MTATTPDSPLSPLDEWLILALAWTLYRGLLLWVRFDKFMRKLEA